MYIYVYIYYIFIYLFIININDIYIRIVYTVSYVKREMPSWLQFPKPMRLLFNGACCSSLMVNVQKYSCNCSCRVGGCVCCYVLAMREREREL